MLMETIADEESDWLQIWTRASSLKGNKVIKKNFVFLADRSVFPNTVTIISYHIILYYQGFIQGGGGGGQGTHPLPPPPLPLEFGRKKTLIKAFSQTLSQWEYIQ